MKTNGDISYQVKGKGFFGSTTFKQKDQKANAL